MALRRNHLDQAPAAANEIVPVTAKRGPVIESRSQDDVIETVTVTEIVTETAPEAATDTTNATTETAAEIETAEREAQATGIVIGIDAKERERYQVISCFRSIFSYFLLYNNDNNNNVHFICFYHPSIERSGRNCRVPVIYFLSRFLTIPTQPSSNS